MTKPVIGIDPAASITEAAALVLSRRIGDLPVIRSDGTLAGIDSEGDYPCRGELGTERTSSRWLEFLVSPGKAADEYVHANGTTDRGGKVGRCRYGILATSLAEVVELMMRHHVKRTPVIDGATVFGIITRSDPLRVSLFDADQGQVLSLLPEIHERSSPEPI